MTQLQDKMLHAAVAIRDQLTPEHRKQMGRELRDELLPYMENCIGNGPAAEARGLGRCKQFFRHWNKIAEHDAAAPVEKPKHWYALLVDAMDQVQC